jgi:hypothetical protein
MPFGHHPDPGSSPRFCARLRPSAVRVRSRSRSTSARPPRRPEHGARLCPRNGSRIRESSPCRVLAQMLWRQFGKSSLHIGN